MASINTIVVNIVANASGFISGIQQAANMAKSMASSVGGAFGNVGAASAAVSTKADAFAASLKKVGTEALGNIARFTSYYLAVGVLKDTLGGAIEEFRKFDENMRNIQSITLESDDAMKKMGDTILKMAFNNQTFGQSASTVSEAMYELVSAGYSTSDALKLALVASQGAAAGLSDTATASKILLSILQAYKLPVEDATAVMDTLFTTVDLGVLHFNDLAANMGYLIPTAAALEVPLDQVGAAIALLTREGQQPSRVMTNLNDVLTRMIKPNKDLAAAIHDIGFQSGSAMVKSMGLVGAVQAIGDAAGGSEDVLAKWFGDVRAIRAILPLAAHDGKDFADMLVTFDNEMSKGSRTALALAEQQKSLNYQITLLTTKLKAAFVIIAEQVRPVLVDFIAKVSNTVTNLAALPPIIASVVSTLLGLKVIVLEVAMGIAAMVAVFGALAEKYMIFIGASAAIIAIIGALALKFHSGSIELEFLKGALLAILAINMAPYFLGFAKAIVAVATAAAGGIASLVGFGTATKALGAVLTVGFIAALAALYVGIQEFSKMSAVEQGIGRMSAIFKDVTAKVKMAEDAFTGLTRSAAVANEVTIGMNDLAKATADAAYKVGFNLSTFSDSFKRAFSLDFRAPLKVLKDNMESTFGKLLSLAGTDVNALGLLKEQVSALANSYKDQLGPAIEKVNNSKGKDKKEAQSEVDHINLIIRLLQNEGVEIDTQTQKTIDQKRAQDDLKIKHGETTTEIINTGKAFDEIITKVKAWVDNLKNVRDYIKEIQGLNTPEDATLAAQIAGLKLQQEEIKPLVEAEKERKKTEEERLKTLQDNNKATSEGLKDQIDANNKLIAQEKAKETPDKAAIKALEDKNTRLSDQQKALDKIDKQYGDQITKIKDAVWPEQKKSDLLDKQVEALEHEAKMKDLILDKVAKEQMANIMNSDIMKGFVITDKERLFLLQASTLLWKGNTNEAIKMGVNMGLTEARATLLVGQFKDMSKTVPEVNAKLSGMAVAAKLPFNVVQDLYNKFLDLKNAGPFDPKQFYDMAIRLGVPRDVADDILKKFMSINTTPVVPTTNNANLDSTMGKLNQIQQKVSEINNNVKNMLTNVGKNLGKIANSATGHAAGIDNIAQSEIATVGEHGPETVFLPKGSSVLNAGKTSQMMNAMARMRTRDALLGTMRGRGYQWDSQRGGAATAPSVGGSGGSPVNVEANFNMNGATLDAIEQQLFSRMQEFMRQLRVSSQQRGTALNGRIQI